MQTPNVGDDQASLPPGWIAFSGHWYYPGPDGLYRAGDDNGRSAVDDTDHQGAQVNDVDRHHGQGINGDRPLQSWDEISAARSKRSNQGSG
jgi:hypothetical protein